MKVFVVGGTGFLGYYAIHEMLRRGHQAVALARSPIAEGSLFPPEVQVIVADVNRLPDAEVSALLAGCDAVVYAAGVDDRSVPRAPAYDYFYEGNVKSAVRFFSLARAAGARRGVLLGSYFTYFNRVWPEMKLAERHPYIRSRVEQARQSLEASLPDLELMVLELGYIFGSMPGRIPLWKPLVDYIRSPMPLFYTRGGTNCVSARQVANAIVGALEQGQPGEHYAIGDENLTWPQMLTKLGQAVGKVKSVRTLPTGLVRPVTWGLRVFHRMHGMEGGLDPFHYINVQAANTFLDPEPSRKALGYGSGDLDQAFAETVAACPAK